MSVDAHNCSGSGVPIVWSGPLQDTTGYGVAARAEILALDAAGIDVRADACGWPGWGARLATGAAERLERLAALDAPERMVHVLRTVPQLFLTAPNAVRAIGRSVEIDGLPLEWVPRCNAMDEIWVASDFNMRGFERAGVAAEKLYKVPETLPVGLYERPCEPLALPGTRGFVFLAVFVWGRRKGWDVLVRAYLDEFAPGEDVSLVLAVAPALGAAAPEQELEAFVREELGRDPLHGPRVVLWPLDLPDEEMPRLYRAADAFAMPSRGEGWGRTYMEAMAAGLPTIGTRWSGNLEFMDDRNSYLVDCEVGEVPDSCWREAPAAIGQRWAEPSVAHLRTLMRRVFEERGEARAKGARARAEILERCAPERFAAAVVERLRAAGIEPMRRPVSTRRVAVQWHGETLSEQSLAVVNRELGRALLGSGAVELGLDGDAGSAAAAFDPARAAIAARAGRDVPPPRVHVRHRWPPDFSRTEDGPLVVYQPWEWGPLPTAWVAWFEQAVDEIWVPSRYVRGGYLESGVEPDKVHVIPNGVDPLRYAPAVPPLELPTGKAFRFLFVGGTIRRKGADIALRSYLETYGPDDDVCLVVKDMGTRSFYRGQTLQREIRELQADPCNAEILYLEAELPAASMPALYAACDCLVAPYRAEGFGLPIVEAMACGLPVIVPDHGACLDYCDPSVATMVPAREMRSPERRVDTWETVAAPRWAEIDRAALAEAMRRVVEEPSEARDRGMDASARVRRELTWARAADTALARLRALAERPAAARPAAGRARARRPTLSGCTIVRRAVDLGYPLEASLLTYLPICDEVVLAYDPDSGDGTEDVVADLARRHRAIRPLPAVWARDDHDHGAEIGRQSNRAIAATRGDWVLYVQADEAIHDGDHDVIVRALARPELVAGLFDRHMFLGTLDRELWHYRARRLLRLFRAGAGYALESAMTCALVPGERRRVLEAGWRMFDYGRVGDDAGALRRKEALFAFHHGSRQAIDDALAGELRQPVAPFDPNAHPAAIRASYSAYLRASTPLAARADVTLAVVLRPGQRGQVAALAEQLRGWPGDVVLIDGSGGDGACEALRAGLLDALGGDRTRLQIEHRLLDADPSPALQRAHELARGRWVLHVEPGDGVAPEALAALPRLIAELEQAGRVRASGGALAHRLLARGRVGAAAVMTSGAAP